MSDEMKPDRFRNGKFPAVYAATYPKLCEIARECGYGLAVHGSMLHDFDLIAVPWIEEPKSNEDFIQGIINAFEGSFVREVGKIGEKPHGRRVWTIYLDGHAYIDLGVMPLNTPAPSGEALNIQCDMKMDIGDDQDWTLASLGGDLIELQNTRGEIRQFKANLTSCITPNPATTDKTSTSEALEALDEFANNFIKEWVDDPIQDGWHYLYETIRQALAQPECVEVKKLRFGINNCLKTAADALRYLAENERPQGGQDLYNMEHLYQIASELENTTKER